ncbi:MAG: ABC transporter permease [Jatrophihabitans sp.]
MSASLYHRADGFASGSSKLTVLQRGLRIVQYRRILKLLVKRDLKVRYAGSFLGYLWTVLDPLLMTLVFWFIFTKIFHRGNKDESPYILFLLTGQLLWSWFQAGVTSTAKSLITEAQMVRSSNVPRELWVLRVVFSKFVEYVLALPVLVVFAFAYLRVPNWRIVFLPLSWIMMFVLLTGLGLLLAPVTVLVRDTERVIPIVLRVLFYLSPVLYSVNSIIKPHPEFSAVYEYNPAVGPMTLARAGFFPHEFHGAYVTHSAVVILVIFVLGVFTFTRLERQVLKEM